MSKKDWEKEYEEEMIKKYGNISNDELRKKGNVYNNYMNEGGDGYNPYFEELERRYLEQNKQGK